MCASPNVAATVPNKSAGGRLPLACFLFAIVLAHATGALARPAFADFVFYRVPSGKAVMVLQGEITVNPGKTITLKHQRFGTFHFGRDEIKFQKTPSHEEQIATKGRQAIAKKDVQAVAVAAQWALRNGLVPQVYELADKALQIDPSHAGARQIKALKSRIDTPIPDTGREEQELRKLLSRDMRARKSAHYVLLYDTSDTPEKGRKLSRAEERLQLLERVYESFLLRFYSQGVELEIPRERMKVVLFQEHKDYLVYSTRLSPSLASTAGFWDPATNVAVFFDQGTSDDFRELTSFADQLQREKAEALKQRGPRTRDIVHLADTLGLLVQVKRENLDIEVVSHEATHQLCGNTGLFPRDVMVPSWVHEGLACYFESPTDAAWSGIGAVNKSQIDMYRVLERDRAHSNIRFIVTDQIFDLADSHTARLHAYGQAWALTHFLMERRFDLLMKYYRRLGELPPHVQLSPQVLEALFAEVFGRDVTALDSEWRSYMNGLRTDVELAIEGFLGR